MSNNLSNSTQGNTINTAKYALGVALVEEKELKDAFDKANDPSDLSNIGQKLDIATLTRQKLEAIIEEKEARGDTVRASAATKCCEKLGIRTEQLLP